MCNHPLPVPLPPMHKALLEFMPAERSEFQQMLPGYLRDGTDPAEGVLR